MSTVLVIAPAVIASWPMISAAVMAAVGTTGFALAKEGSTLKQDQKLKSRAEIAVENSDILGEAAAGGEQIVVERNGVSVRFSRDERGALKVCVEGEGLSKSQLQNIGEDLIGRATQQYAYHRLMTEMKQRNMTVVYEEVDEDRTVRIRIKNW